MLGIAVMVSVLGQGKANSITYLKEHPDMANDIEKRLRDLLLSKPAEADETDKKEKAL